jgi:hypothetical protein
VGAEFPDLVPLENVILSNPVQLCGGIVSNLFNLQQKYRCISGILAGTQIVITWSQYWPRNVVKC